ncbi:hypothetical protein BG003_001357 [Podila horticola]|nr:hypothetical protein BG003_001357 [Podila horticola]
MVEPDQLNNYGDRDMTYFNDIDSSVDDISVFSFRSRKDNFAYSYPFNMTSPPASTVSVPWNVDCRDDSYDDNAGTATVNGKFYYFCEVSYTR